MNTDSITEEQSQLGYISEKDGVITYRYKDEIFQYKGNYEDFKKAQKMYLSCVGKKWKDVKNMENKTITK